MDIYLTDLTNNETFRFPMLPERITVQAGGRFLNYDIMGTGEVKIPLGENLTSFVWEGILPGKARQNEPYVKEWKDPKEIQSGWSFYRAGGKKLRLLITETPVNHDVYLDNYTVDYEQGYGDYKYKIAFIHAKDLKLGKTASGSSAAPRPEAPKSAVYTVRESDTLWDIALMQLGDGSRYMEIYDLNKGVIGADPNKLTAGMVLVLPSGDKKSAQSSVQDAEAPEIDSDKWQALADMEKELVKIESGTAEIRLFKKYGSDMYESYYGEVRNSQPYKGSQLYVSDDNFFKEMGFGVEPDKILYNKMTILRSNGEVNVSHLIENMLSGKWELSKPKMLPATRAAANGLESGGIKALAGLRAMPTVQYSVKKGLLPEYIYLPGFETSQDAANNFFIKYFSKQSYSKEHYITAVCASDEGTFFYILTVSIVTGEFASKIGDIVKQYASRKDFVAIATNYYNTPRLEGINMYFLKSNGDVFYSYYDFKELVHKGFVIGHVELPAVTLNGWLNLYDKPTNIGDGRSVAIPEGADKDFWAMREDRTGINNYAPDGLVVNIGINGEMTDADGRYWIAVGPKVMNPNHSNDEKVTPEEMRYGTKIDVVLKDENGNTLFVYAVVGDVKNHTYPNGIYQTGYAFPSGKEYVSNKKNGAVDLNTIEFMGKVPITGFQKYLIQEIIVYDR